jgi:flagellar biosynthesis regulator FlaF
MIPVARRVLGESHRLPLKMRWIYALALYTDTGATLDDIREAVETLESVARVWTRVFGEAHPETPMVQKTLAAAHTVLATRAAASAGAA